MQPNALKSLTFLPVLLAGCAAEPEQAEVTWYRDVQPIVEEHCVRCHAPDGVGVGDFTDVAQVEAYSQLMVNAVEEQRMPPPVSSPACRDFVGSDALALDASEREVFSSWAAEGLELGDTSDAQHSSPPGTGIEDPDLELLIPAPYVPEYLDPEFADNEYRCFVLDPNLDETTFITALAPVVDEASVLHHAVLSAATRDSLTPAQLAPEGYDCAGGMGLDPSMRPLVAWAPGMLPIDLPDDTGIRMDPEQVFILQIHYYASPGSQGVADQSGYAFRLADNVQTEVTMSQVGVLDFEIPPGEAAYKAGGEFSPGNDKEILGIFPHMHRLGVAFHAELNRDDATTECLVDGTFDFDNQMTYQFREPVAFSKTDSLSFECTWNNSDSNPELDGPPVATGFGERTDEEMCFFFVLAADLEEPNPMPEVEPVDPQQLAANTLRINLATDVAGMAVTDTCSGSLEFSIDGDQITATGGCAFEGPFTMLLGSDPYPVTIDGTSDSGLLTLEIQGSSLEASWSASELDGSVFGVWSVQESELDLGAPVSVFHTGAFHGAP